MAAIGEEIKHWMKENRISAVDMSERVGVSDAYIRQLVTGKKAFGKKQAKKFQNLFGFDETFLLTGIGSLFPNKEKSKDSTIEKENEDLSIVQQLNNLNDTQELKEIIAEQKQLIQTLANHLEKTEKQLDRCISMFEKIINRSYLSSYMVGEEEPQNMKQ